MTEKIVRKGLVIRLYPTEEQKIFLNKSFGCERLFYNYLLNERNEFYIKSARKMSPFRVAVVHWDMNYDGKPSIEIMDIQKYLENDINQV